MPDTPLAPNLNPESAPRCWCGAEYLVADLNGRRCARGHFERSYGAPRPRRNESACAVCRSPEDQAYLAKYWTNLPEAGRRLPTEQVERALADSPPSKLARRPGRLG
jgi:hypothetical protein